MQTPYKFAILSGMPGFMPNYNSGPMVAHTRKEFAEIIRDQLYALDYPANRFRDFNVKRMWRFIQRSKNGSSVHSYCMTHNGEQMSIQGLTDSEFENESESVQ